MPHLRIAAAMESPNCMVLVLSCHCCCFCYSPPTDEKNDLKVHELLLNSCALYYFLLHSDMGKSVVEAENVLETIES